MMKKRLEDAAYNRMHTTSNSDVFYQFLGFSNKVETESLFLTANTEQYCNY